MKKLIYLFVMVVLVSGCATGYHREGFSGGYNDMKIQDDIFKVGFSGNGYCGSERAVNFAMLRCAEVTLEKGYNYFIIIDEKSLSETSSYTTPVTAQTYGTASAYGGYGYAQGSYSGTTYYSGGQTYNFNKPSAVNTIKCFKEKPQNFQGIVYDAKQIKENLRKQYGLDKEENKQDNIPGYSEAGLLIGVEGDIFQILMELNHTQKESSNMQETYFRSGLDYVKKNEADKAIVEFYKALQLNDKYSGAYIMLGSIYLYKPDYDQAILEFNKAIELNPEFAVSYIGLGNAYRYKGDTEKALAAYDRAIEKDPHLVRAHIAKAYLFGEQKNYNQAITECDKSISISPTYCVGYDFRGYLYYRLSDYRKALEDAIKAKDLGCNSADKFIQDLKNKIKNNK